MIVFRHGVLVNRNKTFEVSCATNQRLRYLRLNCRFSSESRKHLELSQIFWPQVPSALFWRRQRREWDSSRFLPGSCQIYILTWNIQDQSAHWFVDEIHRPSRCSRHFNANPSSHIILCFPNETSLVRFFLSFSWQNIDITLQRTIGLPFTSTSRNYMSTRSVSCNVEWSL